MSTMVGNVLADPWALIEEALPRVQDAADRPHHASELRDEAFYHVRSILCVDNDFEFDVATAVAEVVVAACDLVLAARDNSGSTD